MIEILLFAVGIVIGSFLGALSYRLPRNVSIAKGRSFCPNCYHQIAWYDNFPVISFLLLGGKCRNCKNEISIRYPLIELGTAAVFVLIGFNIVSLILACILITVFVIDIEHQIIPDELVFLGLMLVIVNLIITDSPVLFTSLLAGFVSAILLLALNLVTKGKGMGLGDVKLALLLGSLAGLNFFLIWLFLSFLSGAVIGIILMIFNKTGIKERIAFGPFLIIGLILTIYFGNSFIKLIGI